MPCSSTNPGHATNLTGVKIALGLLDDPHRTPLPAVITDVEDQRITLRLILQPRVEVEASVLADGSTRIDCADRGPGVPADELERIFDAFVQSSRTRDGAGGTGLGLAISRRIVAAHGGAIVALAREGGGSVFRITLPGMAWGRSDAGAVDLPLNGGA